MRKKVLYVGLDVHKKTIDVAITNHRINGKVRSYGKIPGSLDALSKLIKKLRCSLSMKRVPAVIRFIVISNPKASAALWWHPL